MIFLSCPKVNVLTKILVDCVCLVLLAAYVLVGQTYAFNGLDIAIIVVNSLYTLGNDKLCLNLYLRLANIRRYEVITKYITQKLMQGNFSANGYLECQTISQR